MNITIHIRRPRALVNTSTPGSTLPQASCCLRGRKARFGSSSTVAKNRGLRGIPRAGPPLQHCAVPAGARARGRRRGGRGAPLQHCYNTGALYVTRARALTRPRYCAHCVLAARAIQRAARVFPLADGALGALHEAVTPACCLCCTRPGDNERFARCCRLLTGTPSRWWAALVREGAFLAALYPA